MPYVAFKAPTRQRGSGYFFVVQRDGGDNEFEFKSLTNYLFLLENLLPFCESGHRIEHDVIDVWRVYLLIFGA